VLSSKAIIMRAIRFALLVASAAAHASPASAPGSGGAPSSGEEPYMGDPALGDTEHDMGDEVEMGFVLTITEEQLKSLFEHMDTKKEGKVPVAELHAFSKSMRRKISHRISLFENTDDNKDGKVSFEEAYPHDETMEGWKQHEQAKFNAADKNKDGFLDAQEYPSYTHPEIDEAVEGAYTRSLFDEKDANKDGVLEFQEVYTHLPDEGEETGTVESYKHDFTNMDKNGNGKIEFEEAKTAWEFSKRSIAAMDWLIDHADTNKDKHITVDELIATKHGMNTGLGMAAGYHVEEWVSHLEL